MGSRDEPDRVHFVDTTAGSAQPAFSPLAETDLSHPAALTAGDTIYVGDQRCDIVSTDSDLTAGLATETSSAENVHTASVVCATALKENGHSTADAIVTHDVVEVLLSGSTQTCASTDRPELRFAADITTFTGSNLCADATACAEVLDYNGANRRVRWSSSLDITHESGIPLMDTNDLTVGDRVSIRTVNDHTYETRSRLHEFQWRSRRQLFHGVSAIYSCTCGKENPFELQGNPKFSRMLWSWLVRWIFSRMPMLQGLHWSCMRNPKCPCSLDVSLRDTKAVYCHPQ